MELEDKLSILSAAAKYDVSCSSSGSKRAAQARGTGNAEACGICHSWAEDGRCISLLKILLTNQCIYDCAYCMNRRSNDIPRARFTPDEIVSLTMNFYQRNYIEGLFLSSGVIQNPDYTMEQMILVAKKLRTVARYFGYIHLKVVPGASAELVRLAGIYSDRLSVNIELPSENALKTLAPEKKKEDIFKPMGYIGANWKALEDERRKTKKKVPLFAPAGQSTQLIVGATPESDNDIIHLSENLYNKFHLKRVYYSAYLHVNASDLRLPALVKPPLLREHRLYQADWLLRYYGFQANEILDDANPFLDDEVDPKITWAIRHLDQFPVEVDTADLRMLLRVPGIGITSVKRILKARRFGGLSFESLRLMGIVLKRARYFITCGGKFLESKDYTTLQLKNRLADKEDDQLLLFANP